MTREGIAGAAHRRLERAARLLAAAVAGLAVPSFALAFFLPVYTDELIWKILQGRIFADGGLLPRLTLEPSCGPYGMPSAPFLLPFRWLDALLYGSLASPLAVRVTGVALGVGWVVFAMAAAARIAGPRLGWKAAALMLATATMGAMPFLLVISRPDQYLLWALTGFFLVLLRPAATMPQAGAAVARAGGGVLLCCFLLAEHPRAIFAVPLMLLFLWRVTRRPAIAMVSCGAIAAFAAMAYRDWSVRWACTGDAGLSAVYARMNLGSALEQGQLASYLHELGASLIRPVGWYLSEFALRSRYDGNIFPGFRHPILGGPIELVFGILLVAGFAAFLYGCVAFRRERAAWLPLAGAGALWLFYGAAVVTRIAKQDYEAELMQPVMALAALGSLWLAWPRLPRWRPLAVAAQAGVLVLLGLSAASQAWLIYNQAQFAFGSWTDPGYPPGQNFSVSAFGYDRLYPEILATARKCGIDPASRPRHLVVDELTYYAFAQSELPLFWTYFDRHAWGSGMTDPTRIWRRIGSAGLIAGCARLDPRVADGIVRNGLFCCHPAYG
jgi:hypothetical protein